MGLFQKWTYFKNWPISKIRLFKKNRRRHNYWKRGVFLEKNATTFGNALYKLYNINKVKIKTNIECKLEVFRLTSAYHSLRTDFGCQCTG